MIEQNERKFYGKTLEERLENWWDNGRLEYIKIYVLVGQCMAK